MHIYWLLVDGFKIGELQYDYPLFKYDIYLIKELLSIFYDTNVNCVKAQTALDFPVNNLV